MTYYWLLLSFLVSSHYCRCTKQIKFLLASLQSEREKKEKDRNRVRRKKAMRSRRKREKAKRDHESDPGACQRPISKRQCSFAAQVRTLKTTRAENEWRSRGVKEPGEMNPLSRPLLSSRPSERKEQAKTRRRRRESWKNGNQWLDVRSEPPHPAPRGSKEWDLHSHGCKRDRDRWYYSRKAVVQKQRESLMVIREAQKSPVLDWAWEHSCLCLFPLVRTDS